ncbi:MAG TPA: MarR family transcriptional regulator [Longimicrobium sp.]|jgi:DNA-binding MarR family transcriptional regulator
MPLSNPTLGTLLRHLIELLDGDVERVYRDAGLDYRPRFTPVVRVVGELGPCSIREIASQASLTHSAASQTVAEMAARGLVQTRAGTDARERIVHLTPRAEALLPVLRGFWAATAAAADELAAELGVDLEDVVARAVDALRRRPFHLRVTEHAERAAAAAAARVEAADEEMEE